MSDVTIESSGGVPVLRQPSQEAVDSIAGHVRAFAFVVEHVLKQPEGAIVFIEAFEDIQAVRPEDRENVQLKLREGVFSVTQEKSSEMLDRWAEAHGKDLRSSFVFLSSQTPGNSFDKKTDFSDWANGKIPDGQEAKIIEAIRDTLTSFLAADRHKGKFPHLRSLLQDAVQFAAFWKCTVWRFDLSGVDKAVAGVEAQLRKRYGDDLESRHRTFAWIGAVALSAASDRLEDRGWTLERLDEIGSVGGSLIAQLGEILEKLDQAKQNVTQVSLDRIEALLLAGGIKDSAPRTTSKAAPFARASRLDKIAESPKRQAAEERIERLWRVRGGEGDDVAFASGFLVPWKSAWDGSLGDNLIRLRDLIDVPLLILLGEPGAGKSTELADSMGTLGAEAITAGEKASEMNHELRLSVDLAELSTRQDVVTTAFDDPVWVQWRADAQSLLRLDIDSVDECHVDLPTVFNVLLGGLGRMEDRDRLRVRLVCRTGVWPVGLQPRFHNLFGEANVRVRDLAPLTLQAARTIAAARGVADLDGFFDAVEHRSVEALAARPVTLKLLCTLFRRDGELPATLEALYRQGCEALAGETNPSRVAANKTGKFTSTERLAVAARLAAVMIFTATDHVWVAPDLGERPKSDLLSRDVAGGEEPTEHGPVVVTEEAVREVVTNTGLFTGDGPNRFTWTHRTIAEFLAAWFMRARRLNSTQVRQLLMHALDPNRVVPQLAQVAAWVAGFDPEFFRHVASSDPAVLLNSDVQNAATADRRTLVEGILTEAAAKAIDDSAIGWRRGYRRLMHDGLAEQLRPWIVNRAGHYLVRRIAIDIAEACEVGPLVDALLDVALDESDEPHVREQAAHAVLAVGNPAERGRLRPLLDDPKNLDTDDELKGSALRALWPGGLSGDELFSKLTLPKDQHFYGAYASFLMVDVPKYLGDGDLAVGLRWGAALIRSGPRHEIALDVQRLMNILVSRSLRAVPSPALDAALAEFLWTAADEDDRIVGEDEESAREVVQALAALIEPKRDAILAAIVDLLAAKHTDDDLARLTFLTPPILRDVDVNWCLQRLGVEKDPTKRRALARLAAALFRRANHQPLEPVLAAVEGHAELADALPEMRPVPIEGPAADASRKHLETLRELQRRTARNRQTAPDAAARAHQLVEHVTAVEGGDPDAWCRVAEALVIGPGARSGLGAAASITDLTGTGGWEACDEITRGRVTAAAEAFVRARGDHADQWFDNDSGCPVAIVYGLQALTLLLVAAPARLTALSEDLWSKWLGTILAFPSFGMGGGFEATRVELLKRAKAAAPNEVRTWFGRLLDREARQRDPRDVADVARVIWDDEISALLLARAARPGLAAAQFGHVVGTLLRQKISLAAAVALRALSRIGRRSYVGFRNRGRGIRTEVHSFAYPFRGKPPHANASPHIDRQDPARRIIGHRSGRDPLWWERALVAAGLLIEHDVPAAWSELWRAITMDAEFGRRFVLRYTHLHNSHRGGPLADALTEEQLADLFLWMEHRFPRRKDPAFMKAAHAVGDRERLAEWREALIEALAERGTFVAMRQLRRIARVVNDQERFFWLINRVETAALAGTWPRPTTAQVLQLAGDRPATL